MPRQPTGRRRAPSRLIASQILAGTWSSPPLKADYVEYDAPTVAQLADELARASREGLVARNPAEGEDLRLYAG